MIYKYFGFQSSLDRYKNLNFTALKLKLAF